MERVTFRYPDLDPPFRSVPFHEIIKCNSFRYRSVPRSKFAKTMNIEDTFYFSYAWKGKREEVFFLCIVAYTI